MCQGGILVTPDTLGTFAMFDGPLPASLQSTFLQIHWLFEDLFGCHQGPKLVGPLPRDPQSEKLSDPRLTGVLCETKRGGEWIQTECYALSA